MSRPRFQVVPGDRMGAAPTSAGWRLLGSNNRELGRSTHVFDRDDDAIAAVAALRRAISELTIEHVRDATGLWRWSGQLAGAGVAHSGRGFRREADCRVNEEQFIACCADALVSFADSSGGTLSFDITV